MAKSCSSRRGLNGGFTLIELLVVVAIILLLAALLLPVLSRVRESGRAAVCLNNLRQIGVGLQLHADSSPRQELCSGAFDQTRDGCMDTWGWVADLVNLKAVEQQTLLCPSNPLAGSEKLNDLYGANTADNLDRLVNADRARATSGICGAAQWAGMSGSGAPASGFASTDPLTAERAQFTARYFIRQGYNTNYASSWLLARTGPRVRHEAADLSLRTNGQAAQQGLKGRRGTLGPLSEDLIASGQVLSSVIPLIGDAAPGDIDEAIAPVDFQYTPSDPFANGQAESATYFRKGELLCESLTEGPAFYQGARIRLIGSYNSRLEVQWQCELYNNCRPPTGGSGNRMYLQSTLSWLALHGGGGRPELHLLFADGSVRAFRDPNADGFLNPGFPVPGTLTSAQYQRTGYRDSEVELPASQCFSGVFLSPRSVKGILE